MESHVPGLPEVRARGKCYPSGRKSLLSKTQRVRCKNSIKAISMGMQFNVVESEYYPASRMAISQVLGGLSSTTGSTGGPLQLVTGLVGTLLSLVVGLLGGGTAPAPSPAAASNPAAILGTISSLNLPPPLGTVLSSLPAVFELLQTLPSFLALLPQLDTLSRG